MQKNSIIIRGAREHNLKNINLELPHHKTIVITGLSGSGKSSLAFDTIYAEGQRRYVESLSSYARQFLDRLQKPKVDHIEGLSPAISIEQKKSRGNPRSIVATQTEIYDYYRLLFSSIGIPHCPKCKGEIKTQTTEEIIEVIYARHRDKNIEILAPIIDGKKGEFKEEIERIKKSGFARYYFDDVLYATGDTFQINKNQKHTISIVIDRISVSKANKERLSDSVEIALNEGKGYMAIRPIEAKTTRTERYNKLFVCQKCHISLEKLEPRSFSFNSPYGACEECFGLGNKIKIDPALAVPDKSKPLIEAIEPWRHGGMGIVLYYRRLLRKYGRLKQFDVHTPFKDLSKNIQKNLLNGDTDSDGYTIFEGIMPNLERRFNETDSEYVKSEINKYMSVNPCTSCCGERLKKTSLAVTIQKKNIHQLCNKSVDDLVLFFDNLRLTDKEKHISAEILKEIKSRLGFLKNVGLGYLTLSRQTGTLSGGEFQRIRLATQIGSGLVGVLYVLDEPSIGLHQKDNDKLLNALRSLRDIGNTLVVVEHDEATIRNADYIVDLGPGAGEYGGKVVAHGTIEDINASKKSLTGGYLTGKFAIPIPTQRRSHKNQKFIKIIGAGQNNLKNIDVHIPLEKFVCVTGVSGSGKSTLVDDILHKSLSKKLYKSKVKPGQFKKIVGWNHIDKVVVVDQAPIGRTPRSNPATYTGTFSFIRDIFSKLPESRLRGYAPGRFSFNVKGGRCEACAGEGLKCIEMHFLPDVYIPCEICKGKRFMQQTLEILYKGKTISDILNMSVSDALEIFCNIPQIVQRIKTLDDVGLGYIKLGQSATTLSGGEAQRVKLATELSKRATGNTLYLLDEPTTGLHFADVEKLINVLNRLVDAGNTVLIIEHNLDVIKAADHIIDLGPEGGNKGGKIIAEGTPEAIAKVVRSHTGQYLKKILNG